MSMMDYKNLAAILIIAWFVFVSSVALIRQHLINRKKLHQRRAEYLEYLERENAKLSRSNNFYRLQRELGVKENV